MQQHAGQQEIKQKQHGLETNHRVDIKCLSQRHTGREEILQQRRINGVNLRMAHPAVHRIIAQACQLGCGRRQGVGIHAVRYQPAIPNIAINVVGEPRGLQQQAKPEYHGKSQDQPFHSAGKSAIADVAAQRPSGRQQQQKLHSRERQKPGNPGLRLTEGIRHVPSAEHGIDDSSRDAGNNECYTGDCAIANNHRMPLVSSEGIS